MAAGGNPFPKSDLPAQVAVVRLVLETLEEAYPGITEVTREILIRAARTPEAIAELEAMPGRDFFESLALVAAARAAVPGDH